MLQRVLQHAMGGQADLDLVMSTLGANPRYIAWGAPEDLSPVGRQAVQAFYEETIVKGGQWFLELDMDRIVVDDETDRHRRLYALRLLRCRRGEERLSR